MTMIHIRRWTPLLLSIFGLATIGSLTVYQLLGISDYGSRVLTWSGALLYIIWLIWESRISIQETQNLEEYHDQGTLELAAITKYVLLFACLLGGFQFNHPRGILGIIFMVLGIGIRAKAILQLGDKYSHRIRLPTLPLRTKAPYSWIRHPAYLGTALAHTGVVLIFYNSFSWAVLVLWYFCIYLRVHVEDRLLIAKLPEYREYAVQVTWKLIPGLW